MSMWRAMVLLVGVILVAPLGEAQDHARAPDSFAAAAERSEAVEVDPRARVFFDQMTQAQIRDLLAGEDPSMITLDNGMTLSTAIAQTTFALIGWTVDGGGGVSRGPSHFLRGTAGQPDAGDMSYRSSIFLYGGHWSPTDYHFSPILVDGFESGDTDAWSQTVGQAP